MDDFSAEFPPLEDFTTTSNATLNSDLATDFLAREQEVLGNDASFFSTPSDQIVEVNSIPVSSVNNNVFNSVTTTESNIGLPDYSAFHSEFPPVEIDDNRASTTIPGTNGVLSGTNGLSSSSQTDERQEELISKRDKESEDKKQETIAKAREAIDKFYEEYNEMKARTHEANKLDEEAFLRERDDITSGTTWERICKHVDISNSQSKSAAKHVKDVSRFKGLLLNLKKDENAPGAGGY
ncbi:9897_t:CDS:2 [Diversispora eburnea]|uniref:Clathrin light chain n=1 Tax=Diversispora eburnea TaxID=1213867 RepID=A0A9N9GLZ2_9GLOM|nr:9897_t:CDS:2 [Diversispora eburnea]